MINKELPYRWCMYILPCWIWLILIKIFQYPTSHQISVTPKDGEGRIEVCRLSNKAYLLQSNRWRWKFKYLLTALIPFGMAYWIATRHRKKGIPFELSPRFSIISVGFCFETKKRPPLFDRLKVGLEQGIEHLRGNVQLKQYTRDSEDTNGS